MSFLASGLCALFLLIALLLIPGWSHRTRRIRRWRTRLDLARHQAVFSSIYQDVDGFKLSRNARKKQDAMEYVYGEINFESFVALLSLCHPDQDTVFYDLGSGTGKAVLAAAMVFDIKKSCGIELLPALHDCATSQQQRLAHQPDYLQKSRAIVFLRDDFLRTGLGDASLVFINASAFFGEYWKQISQHLEHLSPDSIVISTSKALDSKLYTLKRITAVNMSWGVVQVFLQQRLPDPPTRPYH